MSSMLGSLVQAKTITHVTTKNHYTATQILAKLAKKGVKVEETYTSHLVWWPVHGWTDYKPVGYVWLTKPNQGALETWNVFTNPKEENYTSYGFQKSDGTIVTVNFSASNAVDWYYENPKWGAILGPGSTVYSYNSITGEYPTLFLAENLVPQFGVRNGQTVERLSNGEYLYPTGKLYRFNHYVQIPENEVPAQYVSYFEKYYASLNQSVNFWYRLWYPNIKGFGYTARY